MFQELQVSADIEDCKVEVSTIFKSGTLPPIVFLHGYGSSKEEYADVARYPGFEERTIIAFDAPGFAASTVSDPSKVNIYFQGQVLSLILDYLQIYKAHIVGHSMGGLAGLKWVVSNPERTLSFTSVEGNLGPEDCFLSRHVLANPTNNSDLFFREFIKKIKSTDFYTNEFFTLEMPKKIRPDVTVSLFRSMVDISDNDDLIAEFLSNNFPKHYIYGAASTEPTYLHELTGDNVTVSCIPHSGHFPMYSNPVGLWDALKKFLILADKEQ